MSLFLPKDFLYTGSIFSHSEFSLIKNFLQQTELKRNIQNLKFRFSLSFCKEKKQYKTKREPRRQKNKCKNKREGKKEERKRKRKKERKKKERKKQQKKGKNFASPSHSTVLLSLRLSVFHRFWNTPSQRDAFIIDVQPIAGFLARNLQRQQRRLRGVPLPGLFDFLRGSMAAASGGGDRSMVFFSL